MLKFYYSKGSSAIAAHILLEEVAADYTAIKIDIGKSDNLSEPFLRRNPKGRIPVLETPEGTLTENPAILEFIAATHPKANFVPTEPLTLAKARELSFYICSTVHVAFAHHKRPARWATQAATFEDLQQKAPENLRACAAMLEDRLSLSPWAVGAHYSFCDPYLFLIGQWLGALGDTLDRFPRLKAHRDAMSARAASQKVLAIHGIE